VLPRELLRTPMVGSRDAPNMTSASGVEEQIGSACPLFWQGRGSSRPASEQNARRRRVAPGKRAKEEPSMESAKQAHSKPPQALHGHIDGLRFCTTKPKADTLAFAG
jgi:hypothetical protein